MIIFIFLFLGIGIDDMFVIVQCWYNLSEEEKVGKSLHEQIGETMKHAGVAITVTSITDVFAFGIGAVTVSKYEEDFLSFINFINFCSTFCQGHLGYSVHG